MKSITQYNSTLLLLLVLLFGSQVHAQTATVQGSNTLGFVFIPGNDPSGANRNVDISGIPAGATITDVEVRLAVFHRFIGDLIMEVTDPNGETITLVDRPGTNDGSTGDGSDLFRTFPISFSDSFSANPEQMGNSLGVSEVVCRDDGICDYRAFQSGSAFASLVSNINNNNLSANGTWVVNIADVAAGDDDGNFTVPYIRVTFNTIDLILDGTTGDDTFEVVREGNETVVTLNSVEISRVLGAGLNSLTINADSGDDILIVDYDGGDFQHPITFNGEGQNGIPGDILQLNGTNSSYASVSHTFTNESDGTIDVSGNPLLTYTGLEPIVDNLDVANRGFVFNGGGETITLDDGGSLDLRIDSSLGELVEFNEPTGSLSIFSGDGADTINLEGFTATQDFGLFVLGGNAGDATLDVVNLQTNPTTVNGFVTISADQITMNTDLIASGDITIISERQTTINAGFTLETTGGVIDIDAGTSNLSNINHTGFRCNNCTVRTADGNIDIEATGKSNGSSSNQPGIFVNNNGLITTTGTGSISLEGTGGDGVNRNYGTNLANARVLAPGGGDVTIVGNSGTSSGEFNIGVRILETNVTVTSGNLTMNGTSQNTANGSNNVGVWLQGPGNIRSNAGGNMTFTGTGGVGPDGLNVGITPFNNVRIFNNTASGFIQMTGNGGSEGDFNDGIYIQDVNTLISTNGGGLSLTGTGGDSAAGEFNTGIYVASGTLRDQGTGAVQLNGTAGDCLESSDGIFITQDSDATVVSANGGGITMTGQGQTSAGGFSDGVYIAGGLIEELGAGDIDITGTAGSTTNNVAAGIVIASGNTEPTIRANGGDITMGGQGGTSTTGNFSDGVILQNGNVIARGAGNILIDGISGTSTGTKTEGVYWEETVIRSEDGNMNIIGDCEDNLGVENAGVYMINPNFETTGAGNVTIRGASLDASIPGVDQISRDRVNTAGGDLTINGVVGEIQTPDGNAAALYSATNTNFFGRLAPGQSPGRILLTGNLIFPASATLEVEVDAFGNAGTDYDNITVQSGDVDLGGATLALVDNTAAVATGSEVLTLIDVADSAGTVTGTFNGLPNGSAIAFNGETWYLYYNGGDGNDVVLQSTPIVPNVEVDAGGALVFNDPDGEEDDLTIIIEGSNFRLSDASRSLLAGTGANQDGNDVLVPIASVTGNIKINTQDGDDSFTVDFDGGNFANNIEYDGGGQSASGGDILELTGGGSYDRSVHSFFNESDGWVLLDTGAFLALAITYVGLEPVIDNLDVADREFTFTGGTETITLDDSGSLDNRIDSTLGESVDFSNPTNSLTINVNTADDVLNIDGLDAAFNAALTINSPGNTYFNANLPGLTNLTTDAGGTSTINNVAITTTGDQSFGEAVGIFGAVALNGVNVTFGSTIVGGDATAPTDGEGDLSVNASGTSQFGGLVGGAGQRLNSLITDAAGSTVMSAGFRVRGDLIFNDPVRGTVGSFIQSNAGAITFNSTLDGGDHIIIAAPGNFLTFNGDVGATTPVTNIQVSNLGATRVNATLMNASNILRFRTPVEINPPGTGTTRLDAGTVNFFNTLRGTNDGEDSVIISSGNIITLDEPVGDNGQRLANLTIDNVKNDGSANEVNDVTFSETVTLSGNFNQVAGSGTTTFNGAVVGGDLDVTTTTALLNSGTLNVAGNATLTATDIQTEAGISAANDLIATTAVINGNLTPGASPGQFVVQGDFSLSSGDTFTAEVDGITTSGTDYDQIDVTGTVDITDATLTVVDNFAGTSTTFDVLTLIQNDGTDPVTGTFTGLPNGSTVALNGETWYLYYDGGDGNDVVLQASPVNVIVDGAGNLVYSDILGDDDELTIVIDGTNYRLSDPNKPLIAGSGTVQDGNDVLVQIASVTGNININTQDGDDSLNVDLNGGVYGDAINYNGGDQNTTPGDIMIL
ncbi:MAG: hypothetical protein AAF489_09915, partial [Bacteroidota bacterium]